MTDEMQLVEQDEERIALYELLKEAMILARHALAGTKPTVFEQWCYWSAFNGANDAANIALPIQDEDARNTDALDTLIERYRASKMERLSKLARAGRTDDRSHP